MKHFQICLLTDREMGIHSGWDARLLEIIRCAVRGKSINLSHKRCVHINSMYMTYIYGIYWSPFSRLTPIGG